jgi:hypothetical protein
VLSVSDARQGMLNGRKQHCVLCTVSYLCSVRLRKRGKLIPEMSKSKSVIKCDTHTMLRRSSQQRWQPLEDWRWGRVVGRVGAGR